MTVKHLQCLCWPDHGTPEKTDFSTILSLCRTMKESAAACKTLENVENAENAENVPQHIVVHCR